MENTEPRGGIFYGWGTGFNGWGADMDANLVRIGRFGFHLSILDRDLTAPPGSPTSGDSYVVAASATGAWLSKDGQVAVWDGSGWAFGVPRVGWIAYVEDEQKLTVFKATGWSAGISI